MWAEQELPGLGRQPSAGLLGSPAEAFAVGLLPLSFFFFFFLAMPRGMWDLSSWTRDQTHAPCSES